MTSTPTPLRISLLGGGIDFQAFYEQEEGCVLSAAIDKYIFVIIKECFDEKIRVGYTQTEMVDSLENVLHDLVRGGLRKTSIKKKIEIFDGGYSLGRHRPGVIQHGDGGGAQCHVSASWRRARCRYAGPRSLRNRDRRPRPSHWQAGPMYRRAWRARCCRNRFENIRDRFGVLRKMKQLAWDARECLERQAFDEFGDLLHQGWEYKKSLASGIGNGQIDTMYRVARQAGAIGGKISGAGGGGFLLLYCPVERQVDVRRAWRHCESSLSLWSEMAAKRSLTTGGDWRF